MADKLMTARLTRSGNIVSPRGRCLYPSLFEPSLSKGETDPAKAKYQISLLIPKGSDIEVLEKAVQDAIDDNVSAKVRATTKIRMPFLKTADQPRFAELADDFPTMIRCNAKMSPDVLGPSALAIKPEQEADEVYSGRWCRISVRPFWYDHPTGGKGVSFGLQNVQLLEHADPLAGGRVKAENEFEAVGDDLADLEV